MSDIRDDYLKFRVDDDRGSGSLMSSAIKILVIILLVLLLIVLGAVAYKFLFKDEKAQVQTQVQPMIQTKPQENTTNNVVQNVTAAVESRGGGVKKEEIALIVKSVLAQMNKEKEQKKIVAQNTIKEQEQEQPQTTATTDETTSSTEDNTNEDAALLNDLSNADVDNVKEQDIDLSALDNVQTDQEVKSNNKKTDTFNKVIIEKKEVATQDDLTKLYAKLNQIMKKDKSKVKSSNYVSNIKKETKVRSNAMRIITVRKGDTLSLIARRAYGDAMMYPKIFAANPDLIKNPNRIFPGQKLRVPK